MNPATEAVNDDRIFGDLPEKSGVAAIDFAKYFNHKKLDSNEALAACSVVISLIAAQASAQGIDYKYLLEQIDFNIHETTKKLIENMEQAI